MTDVSEAVGPAIISVKKVALRLRAIREAIELGDSDAAHRLTFGLVPDA